MVHSMQIIIFTLFETAAAFYMNKNQASISASQINSLIFKRIRSIFPVSYFIIFSELKTKLASYVYTFSAMSSMDNGKPIASYTSVSPIS